jgi:tetratricopeptide (TPR) repeat protein
MPVHSSRRLELERLERDGIAALSQANTTEVIRLFRESLRLNVLQARERKVYKVLRATAHQRLADAYIQTTDYANAIQELQRADQLLIETKQITERATVLRNLGKVYWFLADYEAALNFTNQSLTIAKTTNNLEQMANAFNNLANIYAIIGDHDIALSLHKENLEIRKVLGDPTNIAATHTNLANAYTYLKQYDAALQHYEIGLDIARANKNAAMESAMLKNLALFYISTETYDLAESFALASLDVCKHLNNKRDYATTLATLGRVLVRKVEHAPTNAQWASRAKAILEESLQILSEVGDKHVEASVYFEYAVLHQHIGDYKTAIETYRLYDEMKEDVLKVQSKQRIQQLEALHHIEILKREAEVERLKNVELAKANEELQAALKRVEQLEEMVTICAWSGKFFYEGKWIRVEEFLKKRFGITASHGISEEEAEKMRAEMNALQKKEPKQS